MPNQIENLIGAGRDFAQGMSNAAASNVSAPVDGISWLLRKLGVPVPDAPVGGSAWMSKNGFTAQPRNAFAGLLGETAGLSAPMVTAAKAPQVASGLLTLAENFKSPGLLSQGMSGSQRGALAWHGPNSKGSLSSAELQDLISSQRFLDRDIVAKKIRSGDFDVKVTPQFELDGRNVRAIVDGHHALEAAIRSGNKPNFITSTPSTNDRVGLITSGAIDDYLEAAYHDSPWYYWASKKDIF